MTREAALTTVKSFPGINNLVPEETLSMGVLREAQNVDLVGNPEQAVTPRLRAGRTAWLADAGAHSLWCNDGLEFALYVGGDGALKALFADKTVQTLVTGLSLSPASFDLINDRIYWSNGHQSGMVTLGLDVYPWAVEDVPRTPVCTPDTAGGLAAGTYLVACTFLDRLGRESGTGVPQATDVVAGGGVLLSEIPQPADADVVTIRLYLSAASGGPLYRHQDLPVGTTDYLVGDKPRGAPLQSQLLVRMPAGHIVRSLNGQMLVARGRELLFSPGLRFGMVDPARGRIGFPKRLDLVEPVTGDGAGVFVACGDKTWFVTGSNLALTEQVGQRIVKHSGVVPGSSCRVDAELLGLDLDRPVPVWLSKAGHFCAGLPGGKVVPFALDTAVMDNADRAATLFRQTGGHRQLIAALRGATANDLAVGDRVTVREYRHDEDL